jgi:acetyl esterase/lipase
MNDTIHPDLRRIARVLPHSAFNRHTLPVMRALSRLPALYTPRNVSRVRLADGGGVRLHQPARPARHGGALLWIHGGGYVLGSAAIDDGLCRRFAQSLNIPVAAVDYRLAPKHPYPAALHDCYQALAWLTRQPGIDPSRIAIGGASAGGGLTAALALLCRDRNEIRPKFQLLVYPMLDDRSSDDPDNPLYRLWTPTTNRLGWAAYLGSADPNVAVPARRQDLAGVAPAWIGVGTLDPLLTENTRYAKHLRDAGVTCQLDTVAGAFHGFDAIAPRAPISTDFFDRQCGALQQAISTDEW